MTVVVVQREDNVEEGIIECKEQQQQDGEGQLFAAMMLLSASQVARLLTEGKDVPEDMCEGPPTKQITGQQRLLPRNQDVELREIPLEVSESDWRSM
jgi:hypothetical protein